MRPLDFFSLRIEQNGSPNRGVVTAIFDACRIQELLVLCKICMVFIFAVEDYFNIVFDIEQALARYFSSRAEAQCLHCLQGHLGAILLGPFSTMFLGWLPHLIPRVPLDIFLDHNHVYELGDWLMKAGFNYSNDTGPSELARPFWQVLLVRKCKCTEETTCSSFRYMFAKEEIVVCLHGTTQGLMDAILSQNCSE